MGARVLAAGGNAADAAVAGALAACAAETIFTGLLGGGFATYWDAETRTATTVDFFVDVPGLGCAGTPAEMEEISVVFGTQRMEYYVGASTVAVPGNPAGFAAVHGRWGRLPWAEVVAPAITLAREGVSLSAAKSAVLHNVRAAMVRDQGARAYAPHGRLLGPGERLHHPGLVDAFELLAAEGAAAFATGDVARALVGHIQGRGGVLTLDDLAHYQPRERPARSVRFAGVEVLGRTDLLDVLGTLAALPPDIGQHSPAQRARAWVRVLLGPEHLTGTSNVCAVDAHGNACAITTSLGLGSTDWVPGYGLHCNSMLGEGELMVSGAVPGQRMPSMMCPLVAVDEDGLVLVAGAAGGSRIRSSLVQTLTGVLAEGLDPQVAVERPRLNPVHEAYSVLVHVEPDMDPQVTHSLMAEGLVLEQWTHRSAYFGGVSMIGRAGAAADPRRDGAVAWA
jgi:gamma-glutamyltranspeptidase/glutathione hydrolase